MFQDHPLSASYESLGWCDLIVRMDRNNLQDYNLLSCVMGLWVGCDHMILRGRAPQVPKKVVGKDDLVEVI